MNFKKWMNEISSAEHIGNVAVFYIPIKKLDKKNRKELHEFFVKNYYAYTHEKSKIQGFWSKNSKVIKDQHERYEISFKGKNNLKKFLEFLSNICYNIKEDSIYLTIGGESYLVKPKKGEM